MNSNNNYSLEKKILELTVLHEISQLLISHSEAQDALTPILEILHSRMGMERGTITLIDSKSRDLVIEVAHGLTDEEMRRGHYQLGEGVTGTVVEKGEPMIVPRVGKDPLFLDRTRSRSDIQKDKISFICVPIRIGDLTFGTLSVDRVFNENISLDEDLRFLTILAFNIAQAIKINKMAAEEKNRLKEENISLKEKLRDRYRQFNIVGRSNRMREVFLMIEQVSSGDATVLIRGESGTGKELAANAIHYNSPRMEGPFIKVNCAAFPENLIESELFGYEKGAFTGAMEKRIGKFEKANGGTLFLDEVGILDPGAQEKLFRALRDRGIERIGGSKTVSVDVRIIAATDKPLETAMKEGLFREDLYYRLNIFPIYMPPLRERKTDILLLADFFLEKYSKKYGKDVKRISTPAIDAMMHYHWPGNVRELEDCIERAIILCSDKAIHSHHLPPTVQTVEESSGEFLTGSLKGAMESYERSIILNSLKSTGGNIAKAARMLGTSERILGIRVKKFKINPAACKLSKGDVHPESWRDSHPAHLPKKEESQQSVLDGISRFN
jgi:Nif-specific regulatory protein